MEVFYGEQCWSFWISTVTSKWIRMQMYFWVIAPLSLPLEGYSFNVSLMSLVLHVVLWAMEQKSVFKKIHGMASWSTLSSSIPKSLWGSEDKRFPCFCNFIFPLPRTLTRNFIYHHNIFFYRKQQWIILN